MIIQFALILTVLLGCCALVLDLGLFELRKIQMQNAADAAALGAMHAMEDGAQKADWQSAGKSDAKLNGFTDTQNGVGVAVDNPTYGLYANNSSAIQVTVTQKVQPIFSPASWTLNVQSTALAPPAITPCIYGRSSTSNGLNVSGSDITTDCSFYLGHSMTMSNTYVTNSSSTPKSYLMTGSSTQSSFSGSVPSLTQLYGQSGMPDPLSFVVQPPPGNCDPNLLSPQPNANKPPNLSPGIYCGQLVITNIASPGITMNPGLYTFTHGISITNSTVNGTGITFFLTKNTVDSWSSTQPSSQQFYSSGSNLTLSAPVNDTTGPPGERGIQGILVFADRNWNTGGVAFSLGGTYTIMDGIIYTPYMEIFITNSPLQSPNYLGMDADSILLTNDPITLKSDYSPLVNGNPFQVSGSGGSGGGLVE